MTDNNGTPDFGYLSQLEINKDTTATFVLRNMPYADDGTMPELIVRPATKENVGLFADHLRRAQRAAIRADNSVTPETLDRFREDDRVLYPKHVIVGWNNVRDGKNQPVTFSNEGCVAYVRRLPPWLFDKLRAFCEAPENFAAAQVDGTVLGKG